jgi:hypothetical protein
MNGNKGGLGSGLQGTALVTGVVVNVQNLPVAAHRRVRLERQALVSEDHQVAAVCPKGRGDPAYEVFASDQAED